MKQLEKELQQYHDTDLVELFLEHRDEYTPEAYALIEGEIKRRNIDVEKERHILEKNSAGDTVIKMDVTDFEPFDHVFNKVDLELAAIILRDNEIPFYADNPQSSTTFPLVSEAEQQFTIHVHKSGIEKTHALLDEHFEKTDGSYRLKKMSIKEQLKLFSFHDLQITELEAEEEIEVSFSEQEKKTIIRYAENVLRESDRIEQEQDRVLFYFDTIETVISNLSDSENTMLTKTDLLTILEIMQVVCDDNDFPEYMEEVLASLLGFFRSDSHKT